MATTTQALEEPSVALLLAHSLGDLDAHLPALMAAFEAATRANRVDALSSDELKDLVKLLVRALELRSADIVLDKLCRVALALTKRAFDGLEAAIQARRGDQSTEILLNAARAGVNCVAGIFEMACAKGSVPVDMCRACVLQAVGDLGVRVASGVRLCVSGESGKNIYV